MFGPKQHRSGTVGAIRMHMLAESIRAAARVLRRREHPLEDREQSKTIEILNLHSERLWRLIAEIVPLSQEIPMDLDAAA